MVTDQPISSVGRVYVEACCHDSFQIAHPCQAEHLTLSLSGLGRFILAFNRIFMSSACFCIIVIFKSFGEPGWIFAWPKDRGLGHGVWHSECGIDWEKCRRIVIFLLSESKLARDDCKREDVIFGSGLRGNVQSIGKGQRSMEPDFSCYLFLARGWYIEKILITQNRSFYCL